MGRKELVRVLAREVSKRPVYIPRNELRGEMPLKMAEGLLPVENCFILNTDTSIADVVYSRSGKEVRLIEKANPNNFISAGRTFDGYLVNDGRNINPIMVDELSLREILEKEMQRRGFSCNADKNGVLQAK